MAERHSRLFRDVRFSSKGRAKRAKPILIEAFIIWMGPFVLFIWSTVRCTRPWLVLTMQPLPFSSPSGSWWWLGRRRIDEGIFIRIVFFLLLFERSYGSRAFGKLVYGTQSPSFSFLSPERVVSTKRYFSFSIISRRSNTVLYGDLLVQNRQSCCFFVKEDGVMKESRKEVISLVISLT